MKENNAGRQEKTKEARQMTINELATACYSEGLKRKIKIWTGVSRRAGFEPYITDGRFFFRNAVQLEIQSFSIETGLTAETIIDDFKLYLNSLHAGEKITVNYITQKTGIIKRVNKNREGCFSSLMLTDDSFKYDSDKICFSGLTGLDIKMLRFYDTSEEEAQKTLKKIQRGG
ncbi:MAG: hypothetical protein WC775_06240 [Patescibacteria group bacterium]|jgi:hypothetical protein